MQNGVYSTVLIGLLLSFYSVLLTHVFLYSKFKIRVFLHEICKFVGRICKSFDQYCKYGVTTLLLVVYLVRLATGTDITVAL